MHGLGNDFVVFDAVHQSFMPTSGQARYLADRHFGIGCDQILVVEEPPQPGIDFHYRIFNADGCEVEQCGNGARCFARFVHDQGLTDKREIRVGTRPASSRRAWRPRPGEGQHGRAALDPRRHSLRGRQQRCRTALQVADKSFDITAVSMGNPHAVQLVDDVDDSPVGR